ncbi:MAG: fatty acid desaturase, partial [Algiphilus sp.]
WFLTMANYVEHYGLLRQKQDDGRYERCRPEHSWNTNHTMSNLVLFHLQRHSDHHAYPTRSYQSLRHFEDLPTLPSGYPGMFTLAMFPPLWRAVMDPRVLELYDQDIHRVNLDPKQRDSILRRYAGRKSGSSTATTA